MIFDDLKDSYPVLSKTAEYLENNCYFFKGVLKQIRDMNPDYKFGEELCTKALTLNNGDWKEYYKKVHTLIDFSLEFLRLQIKLEKTGKYLFSSFAEVEDNAYHQTQGKLFGPWYTWALYFSQFFWVTHYRVFDFFLKEFVGKTGIRGNVLEVPTGTGLFIANFLSRKPDWQGTGVDLADSSLDFTRQTLSSYYISASQINLIKENIYKFNTNKKFDRIMCGEFLEHLEDPLGVLKKMYSLLNDDGEVFITVAVWAAMIDHIYLYKSAQEVRDHIKESGFVIKKELVQTVFKNTNSTDEKVPINYCAILTK
jgi:2-polyprenyl-3-methyl-5-hydroxy-6-metoxy-1,4-benzoquinol methylase